jgi:formylglycine-generating enzyme required for sulfatase activity
MTRFVFVVCVVAGPVVGQTPPPDYDFNFVTIGDVGNFGYDREDLFGRTAGRGVVNYEYRMARTEITSSQFAEFRDAYLTAGHPAGAVTSIFWGGGFDGERFVVPAGNELLPVAGLSWRGAAVICNWLHNGKGTAPADFLSGAYDTSTFTDVPGSNVLVNDQTMRSPGAKYWIPSFDEWLKAAHWDPDKNDEGDGGWWLYNNSSDVQPVIGLPGDGETSAGYEFTGFGDEYDISLEAYPDTRSAWGLLDVSGGTAEWSEEWFGGLNERRVAHGNAAGDQTYRPNDPFDFSNDLAWVQTSGTPDRSRPAFSFRIASAIPAPGTGVLLVCGSFLFVQRKRR